METQNQACYSWDQIIPYLSTRLSSLAPPKNKPERLNVIKALGCITTGQWLMFICGLLGRAWDSFGYTTVTMTLTELAKDFNASDSAVSWAVTATLMMRPVGALIFGTLCDRYGRRWPMIANLFFLLVLEMASGFCMTLNQFIAVRSLYGIAMGGLIGPSASIALEDLPPDARGVLSGVFEGGHSLGNLITSAMYRALVPTTKYGWRSLFWFGAGPPVLLIILRWYLPETQHFKMIKAEREARTRQQRNIEEGGYERTSELQTFLHESGMAIKNNWLLLLYMFLLMAGFNAAIHGSVDMYPTFLKNQAQMDASQTSLITSLASVGSICGGIIVGYISGLAGRRLTMMCACVLGGALLPAYILPRGMVLVASAFFQHFANVGAWGPIPVYLVDLAPDTIRTLIVGFTYQLGNLAASPMTTVETYLGEKYPLESASNGTKRYNYGLAIMVLTGGAWTYSFLCLLFGPEGPKDETVIEGTTKSGIDSEPPTPTGSLEKESVVCEVDYDGGSHCKC